jgi:hypothetical protein
MKMAAEGGRRVWKAPIGYVQRHRDRGKTLVPIPTAPTWSGRPSSCSPPASTTEPSVHAQLLVVAAVAQALLLTGGGACLAAQAHATRSLLLGVAWAVSTLLTVLVLAPTAYAGVSAHLAEELPAPWLRWDYAAVLVLSVEVMAGGCLVAAGARKPQDQALLEALPSPSGIWAWAWAWPRP